MTLEKVLPSEKVQLMDVRFSSVVPEGAYRGGGFYDDPDLIRLLSVPLLNGAPTVVRDSTTYDRPAPVYIHATAAAAVAEVLGHYAAMDKAFPALPPIVVAEIKDALVNRNIIYTGSAADRRVLYETYRPNDRPFTVLADEETLESPGRLVMHADRVCCYLGSAGAGNYGHWLVDDLPRAVLAIAAASAPILWIIPTHSPGLDEAKRQSLTSVLGTSAEIVFVPQNAVVAISRLLYVSPVTYHPSLKSPDALRAVREKTTDGLPGPKGRRLFVTRSGDSRLPLNLDEAQSLLEGYGFETIEPSQLSFIEQSETFAGAVTVVGIMGAAMTNTMFCSAGTQLCYLAPEGWVEPFYWDLAAVMGHQYACIYGLRTSLTEPSHLSNFTIDLPALRLYLAHMFLDEEMDKEFYRGQLAGADVDDLVGHYISEGWRLGLNPRRDFSTRFYLAAYADLIGDDQDPFSHWLGIGRKLGLATNASAMTFQVLERDSEFFDLVSEVIDRTFYVRQFPSLRGTTINAAQHYVVHGWRLGLVPSPRFSAPFYLERSPDVAAAGINPLYHYLRWGRSEGRAGHPDDVGREWVATREEDILIAAHFDRTFYLDSYPEVAANNVDPVRHYIAFGWRQGFDPTRDFSTSFYINRSPDVQAANANPFGHYLRWGRAEGRAPSPDGLLQALAPHSTEEALVATLFDAPWYRAAYPDIARNHIDPLKHYLKYGWRNELDPSPDFSTSFYLKGAPELWGGNQSPLGHYVSVGRARGRLPKPPLKEANNFFDSDEVFTVVGREFDFAFYAEAYPETGTTQEDLLEDYLLRGWRVGRDPHPGFSTSQYLAAYPDVDRIGFNPFYHYLTWGRRHGFSPAPSEARAKPALVFSDVKTVQNTQLRSSLCAPPQKEPSDTAAPVGLDPQSLDLHWIIPDLSGPGKGGHMTILRIVRWLELFGHRCTLWINDPDFDNTPEQRKDLILSAYQVVQAEIRTFTADTVFPSDAILIATSWETAYFVNAITHSAAKFYFVQDQETAFYPAGSHALAADQTYDLNLGFLCAGPWLEQLLSGRAAWVRNFHLAADDCYVRAATRQDNPIPRIAFYARGHTSRRAVELGLLALEQLASEGVAFQAELFGADETLQQSAFAAINHGVLDGHSLAQLYASCDVGLCLSATNYSLTPQEMMACGLPVVELDGPNTRGAYPEGVAMLAAPTPTAIATAIRRLLEDPQARQEQTQRASRWVDSLSWEQAGREVERAIRDRLHHLGAPVVSRGPSACASAPVATVVIPTFNGGDLFRAVLERVKTQRTPWSFEIIVVDSSSTDGTWEFLETYGDAIRAWRIAQSEFQHGRTRNAAIAEAKGEFVALLTQDALPDGDFWLYNLVETLRRHPKAAGAFGRHFAWPDASPFVKRDITAHFDSLGRLPLEVSKYTDLNGWREQGSAFRRLAHFFSDNNACLRRAVWRRHPYPEIEFGEDQLWAQTVLKAGYSRVYAPLARVWHSHDYDEASIYERARVEARFLYRDFGYEPPTADPAARIRQMNLETVIWGARHSVSPELIAEKQRLNASEVQGAALGYEEGLAAGRRNPGASALNIRARWN